MTIYSQVNEIILPFFSHIDMATALIHSFIYMCNIESDYVKVLFSC